VTRLPYEPSGWLREFRTDLQNALRAMTLPPSCGMLAEYASPDSGFADLENVLLYNLGSGCLSHLLAGGITCRRLLSPDKRHHLAYRMAPLLPDPAPGAEPLATVKFGLDQWPNKPSTWWVATRPHLNTPDAPHHDGEFGLDIQLSGPDLTGTRITGLIKPMLDGLVAALHAHDGSHRDLLAPRLAQLGDPHTIWPLLCNPDAAVLGVRTLVRPYRSSVAWNPADERCAGFRIQPALAGRRSITVRLLSLPDS
jgi:hypothetical protein